MNGGGPVRRLERACAAVAAIVLLLAAAVPASADGEVALARLQEELERIAAATDGVVGVGLHHLPTGRELFLQADAAFPMASTYKVPIAIQLLHRVDRGEVSLDTLVEVEADDLHPGSGTLSQLFDDPGVILSLRNLLELMLLISDNSATDLVLEQAGGAAAVTERMQALGFSGIRVDRPTVTLIGDWLGLGGDADRLSLVEFGRRAEAISEAERERAAELFDRDPRDVATPRAMTGLLAALARGELLSASSTELLLDILSRCQTGAERLPGLLPPGVGVSHKTGTIGGTTNDVGILHLPAGAGDVVAVVLIRESERPVAERERTIAQLARAAYDFFLFHPE